jgi:hypothetical protein
MYGLKPVPFECNSFSARMKPVPFECNSFSARMKPLPFEFNPFSAPLSAYETRIYRNAWISAPSSDLRWRIERGYGHSLAG